MVFASTAAGKAAARAGLNGTATELRVWHERLLYGSSTANETAAVEYRTYPVAAYRSTPLVEQVKHYFMLSAVAALAGTLLACNVQLGCN